MKEMKFWKTKENEKTDRNFPIRYFTDVYDMECSIQESSLATHSAIWLGVNDADPKILVPGKGWVQYPIHKDVLLHTRMHLTQEMVKELLPVLQKFAETGEI